MIRNVAACSMIVGVGLVMLLLAGLLLAHGYLVMGYRWSQEQAPSLTGRVYGGTGSRSLMRFYLAVLGLGPVVAALGLVGLLITWALNKVV